MRYYLATLLLIPSFAFAQMIPRQQPLNPRDWTAIEIVLSVGVLIVMLVLIIIEAILIAKAQKPWSPAAILKVFGLTLIVCFSAFLVTAGYDQDQIGPVMGLLGVIAGYLLGDKSGASSNAPTKE
jgi:FtsH-binding integral membrane protein